MNDTIIHFIKDNWSQLLLLSGGIVAYFTGRQSRVDKHLHEKSLTFNIDIDTLADSFDLTQKILATVRIQLDETQESLNRANEAYGVLKKELIKAMQDITRYKEKSSSLGAENKELMKRLNTCEFDCKNKVL